MKILVAGASGAVGRSLVPRLVEAGHEVVGTARSTAKADALRASGADGVVLDVLDGEAVREVVRAVEPEVVIHQATSLKDLGADSFRKFDQAFATTNRLRTLGTDTLLRACAEAGVRRFVAQSYAGWPYARTGGPAATEEHPLDPDPPANARQTLDAIRRLEAAVTSAGPIEGVVLRYGGFYGPGTGLDRDGDQAEMIRKRRFPIVGNGAGVWSFCHIDDAATATVAAVAGGGPGVYNVVDDEPAPVSVWLPFLAEALGAPPPRRIPLWLARPLVGPQAIAMMTTARGASNAKAKRELDWHPTYTSWRDGFLHGLG